MILNSNSVADYIKESDFSKRTQIGIDLSVCKIEKIMVGGEVYTDETIINPEYYLEVETFKCSKTEKLIYDELSKDTRECWELMPGAYSLTFNEGVQIPPNCTGFILQRSSLYRMGNQICSPVWDPGFKTDQMGTTLIVNNRMIIEKNARVAQFFLHENAPVEELYDGQFQNKANY
jgi:deoxycytidine triphosphate deaminase